MKKHISYRSNVKLSLKIWNIIRSCDRLKGMEKKEYLIKNEPRKEIAWKLLKIRS